MNTKMYQTTLTVLCLLGNVIHICWISQKYLLYEVKSSVRVEVPPEITPPSVSLFTNLHRILLWEDMTDKMKMELVINNGTTGYDCYGISCGYARNDSKFVFAEFDKKGFADLSPSTLKRLVHEAENQSAICNLLSNLIRLNDRLLHLSLQFKQTSENFKPDNRSLFDGYDIIAKDGDEVKWVSWRNWKRRQMLVAQNKESLVIFREFSQIMKRFSIVPDPKHTTVNYFTIRSHQQGRLFKLHISRRYMATLGLAYIILCADGYECYFELSQRIVVDLTKSVSETISYEEYRSILLPHPYTTGCLSYRDEGFSNKESCYMSCVNSGEEERYETCIENRSEVKDLPTYSSIRKFCRTKCNKPSCENVLLIPRFVSRKEVAAFSFQILLQAPYTPPITTKASPEISMEQYSSDVLSSLGTWIGISAIGTADFLIQYVALVHQYIRMKRKVNCEHTKWPSVTQVRSLRSHRIWNLGTHKRFEHFENELKDAKQQIELLKNQLIEHIKAENQSRS